MMSLKYNIFVIYSLAVLIVCSCSKSKDSTNSTHTLTYFKNEGDSLVYVAERSSRDSIEWINFCQRLNGKFLDHVETNSLLNMVESKHQQLVDVAQPILLWRQFQSTNDTNLIVKMSHLLEDGSYLYRTQRYALLMCQQSIVAQSQFVAFPENRTV